MMHKKKNGQMAQGDMKRAKRASVKKAQKKRHSIKKLKRSMNTRTT